MKKLYRVSTLICNTLESTQIEKQKKSMKMLFDCDITLNRSPGVEKISTAANFITIIHKFPHFNIRNNTFYGNECIPQM